MSSEAMVRHLVGVAGAQVLIDITQGAWNDYINEGHPRFHRSTRAAIVWDYMVQRADEEFQEHLVEGVTRQELHERPLYVVRGMVVLRPKKHDRYLQTRNYPTMTQRRWRSSGRLPEMDLPSVAFGYRLDAAEAGVEQCVISSPADDWVIDLDDLASGNLQPTTPMFEMPEFDAPWRQVEAIKFRAQS